MTTQRFPAFPGSRRQSADQGQIFLGHLAARKGRAQREPGGLVQSHEQKPACVFVQSVHNAGAQAVELCQLRKAPEQALHQRALPGRTGRDAR